MCRFWEGKKPEPRKAERGDPRGYYLPYPAPLLDFSFIPVVEQEHLDELLYRSLKRTGVISFLRENLHLFSGEELLLIKRGREKDLRKLVSLNSPELTLKATSFTPPTARASALKSLAVADAWGILDVEELVARLKPWSLKYGWFGEEADPLILGDEDVDCRVELDFCRELDDEGGMRVRVEGGRVLFSMREEMYFPQLKDLIGVGGGVGVFSPTLFRGGKLANCRRVHVSVEAPKMFAFFLLREKAEVVDGGRAEFVLERPRRGDPSVVSLLLLKGEEVFFDATVPNILITLGWGTTLEWIHHFLFHVGGGVFIPHIALDSPLSERLGELILRRPTIGFPALKVTFLYGIGMVERGVGDIYFLPGGHVWRSPSYILHEAIEKSGVEVIKKWVEKLREKLRNY